MNASRKPSIATEVHASHERPHRLAVLATSPVATGEAEIGEPRKGTETKRKQSPPLSSSLISKPYPRKGTETFFQKSVTFVKPADFKTISPQGDGNSSLESDDEDVCIISKPYPRKGTERTSSLPCQSEGGGPRKRWRGRHERKP